MHSATPQLEPALQSGLSTIIMAGRNLRSLPWHCSVFWAHTHPEIMARQTIKTDIGCPLKANMSSKLQLVVCCGRTRQFRWFLFCCALSTFEERDLWAEKAQPSPAQPQPQSQLQPQRQTAVFIRHFHPTVLYTER